MAEGDDASVLVELCSTVATASEMFLVRGVQGIVLAQGLTGEQSAVHVDHDVTSSSRTRNCRRARRAWLLTVPKGNCSRSAIWE